MQITVVVPPPFEPVSMADVYAHLRLDPIGGSHPDDDMLTRQIRTAREQVEQITRRAVIQQTLAITLCRFPCEAGQYVELKRPPYISGAAISYYDTNNALQVLDPSTYYVDDVSDIVSRLYFIGAAPATYVRADNVRVSWVAGYLPAVGATDQAGYAANVPASIKDAVLIGVQLLYDEIAPDKRDKLELLRTSMLSSYHVHSF